MTMKSVDLPHLRSVVLAGHAGSGKTTLAEQLLHRAGAIPRLGRVDDGTAHLDFEPEEQKRRESLSLAVGTFESDGTRISLVDTPG
ncbi:MAG: elongation factor, partial [Chloroflexota bacterium]|nr:elongation factor [Chloroflexota bacterium]